jgi:dihydrofolate synthase/folylpolyglutamate synthase
MIAAIVASHGLRAGAYLSPHLVSFGERIRVGDEDLSPADFAAAITRAARAAELVNRAAPQDDHVTQFELLTAAAYAELGRRGVDVAVIEAGLGGRYDATNVIPSEVAVLTSVGLEHTRWLGPTITHIAAEKLDVVREGGTLALGSGLHPDALAVARRVTAQRNASLVYAPADPGISLAALGSFQRRNFALARTVSEAFLGSLDERAVARAASVVVPGRLQVVGRDPLTVIDGAHNPQGIAALVESLPELRAGRRPLAAVVSILDDKDAAAMLRTLLPSCDALICTSSHNPRALPPPTLESLARQLEGPLTEIVSDPSRALARARALAGPGGAVLATGSIYLVGDLLGASALERASTV